MNESTEFFNRSNQIETLISNISPFRGNCETSVCFVGDTLKRHHVWNSYNTRQIKGENGVRFRLGNQFIEADHHAVAQGNDGVVVDIFLPPGERVYPNYDTYLQGSGIQIL